MTDEILPKTDSGPYKKGSEAHFRSSEPFYVITYMDWDWSCHPSRIYAWRSSALASFQ